MITVEKKLDIGPGFDFELIAKKEQIVYFDIETTGLSAGKSNLYLIGTVTYDDGEWMLRQFFAESLNDEEHLLYSFFKLLSEKRKQGRVILISYNGDGFDIPFIKSLVKQYMLPYDFINTLSLDMLKVIRPYKQFLGLCDCKLKSVEKLCNIQREDKYNGGELIYVYEEYLHMAYLDRPENAGLSENNELNKKLRRNLLDTLLLHNAEDIADMPMLMDIFAYDYLFKGKFEIEKVELLSRTGESKYSLIYNREQEKNVIDEKRVFRPENKRDTQIEKNQETYNTVNQEAIERAECGISDDILENSSYLNIRAKLHSPLPKGIYIENPMYTLSISEEDKELLELTVNLYYGELKYFFVDYRNYYYLTEEDYAVHKSVGEFVDRRFKKQATAATCYQKEESLFLPVPEPVIGPVFYEKYKGDVKYARIKDIIKCINDNYDKVSEYVLAILKGELHGCNR